MTDVTFRRFDAADRDWLVDQHGLTDAREEGFDDTFGPLVAAILDAFLADHDPARERGWIAQRGAERLGSIFCVQTEDPGCAKLRLFLLVPQARGQGVGQRLLDQCLRFAREAGYGRMKLWTHESHAAACALNARNGFAMNEAHPVRSFGCDLVEQTWQISL